MANQPVATFVPKQGGGVKVYSDKIIRTRQGVKPLIGVKVSVESGSDLKQRITVTRMALMGPLALAAKKSSGGEQWLIIEVPDFAWTIQVDRKEIEQALGSPPPLTSQRARRGR